MHNIVETGLSLNRPQEGVHRPSLDARTSVTTYSRRHFVKTFSTAAVILVADPLSFIPEAEAAQFQAATRLIKEATEWFAKNVLPPGVAEYVVGLIKEATTSPAPPPRDLHEQHSVKVVINMKTQPVRTIYKRQYFQINQFSRTDSQNPPRVRKDLNLAEMGALASPLETNYHGCVLFPCSERQQPTYDDRIAFCDVMRSNKYRRTGFVPRPEQLEYVRPFNDGTNQFIGYGFKAGAGHGLVITPDPFA
jgi:hypothetical protein